METRTDDRAFAREAYTRLELWREGCRWAHDRAREARRILLLRDPRQDEPGKPPVLQLQTLKSTFTNCVADQIDNMPEAVLEPETRELAPVAEDLTDVVRCILERNDWETLHRRRAEDCFCTGTAVTQVAWDPEANGGRGEAVLLRWPIEGFLWDPSADSLQEGRAVFKLSLHPMSWFRQHWPEKASSIRPDGEMWSGVAPDAREEGLSGDEPSALLAEYWTRRWDPVERRYQVDAAYLAGGAVLERRENVYRHGLYPFVLDVYTPIEGTPVGEGMVQELAPMMRAVNRYRDYIDANLRMAAKGRLLVDRSAGIDREALCDWEKDVIEADRVDAGALQWLQSRPFGPLASQQMLQLQADIKQDSGQNQFTRGEPVGGVTAASAISALQEAGGKVTRLRTAVLNRGFREMVMQLLWLVSQFYTPERVVWITGGGGARLVNASPERLFGRVNGEIPPPPYTVRVQVQRRNPLRVQAQNELFLEAYRMSAQAGQYFPLSALFTLLQVDGKDRVLPLLRAAEEVPERVAALKEERDGLLSMCRRAEALLENALDGQGEEVLRSLAEENARLKQRAAGAKAGEKDEAKALRRRRSRNGEKENGGTDGNAGAEAAGNGGAVNAAGRAGNNDAGISPTAAEETGAGEAAKGAQAKAVRRRSGKKNS